MSVCAIENAQVDNHERALSLFNCVLENQPIDPITLTSKGHLMRTNGQQEEAIKNYRKALRNCPSHCEAFYALSNLKTYKFLENEIMAMRQQEKSDALTIQNRIYLYFGLAKAFEDLKNYDLSFDYYNKGNLLKKRKSGYDSDKMAEDLGAQKKFFTPDLFRCKDGFGCNKRDPIFIVGLPRAGSTLLEQILSSHSEVDGTLELPNILSLTQKLRLMRRDGVQPGYPEIISKISPDE
jgi:tetratricopeptide (TPR) repeat protein